MISRIEFYDDFLSSHQNSSYKRIFNGGTDSDFVWFFCNDLNGVKGKGNFYFNNTAYEPDANIYDSSQYFIYEPLLNRLNITLSNVKRIKANLYPWTGRRIHHSTHIDYDPNQGYKTCLYYVHDSNRLTIFDRKAKIKCKNNRAIIFDGSIRHHTTSPTDVNYSCSINIDYRE